MKKILFATTNARKIQEANESLELYGITVDAINIEIDEIQHHDSAEITKAKAKSAYEVVQKPVVVQDTTWEIPALNGFPGGYMKDVHGWLVEEDWMALMARHEDQTIFCIEHVAYYDGAEYQHFQSRQTGSFVKEPRGVSGNSLERTVTLGGDKTLAELHDEGKVLSAHVKLEHWEKFAKWYASR